MGLLKETMQAIIRFDRKTSTMIDLWRFETMRKDINRESIVKEIPGEPKVDLRFAYPENLTFGGRFNAVQLFSGLEDREFCAAIGLTTPQGFSIYKGETAPWPALYRAISRRYNIDETWLATGHLPQTTEEPAKPFEPIDRVIGKTTPLSGHVDQADPTLQKLRGTYFRYDPKELFRESMDRVHQSQLEVRERLGIQEDSH